MNSILDEKIRALTEAQAALEVMIEAVKEGRTVDLWAFLLRHAELGKATAEHQVAIYTCLLENQTAQGENLKKMRELVEKM